MFNPFLPALPAPSFFHRPDCLPSPTILVPCDGIKDMALPRLGPQPDLMPIKPSMPVVPHRRCPEMEG